jgi:hypothetical protein
MSSINGRLAQLMAPLLTLGIRDSPHQHLRRGQPVIHTSGFGLILGLAGLHRC